MDGDLVVTQLQEFAKRPPGLQRERAQTQGESTAESAFGIGQCVHDPGIAQGLAATRTGHVDDESTVLGGLAPLAGSQLGSPVLPAVARIAAALTQGFVVAQRGQVCGEARQCMGDDTAVACHAKQVLIECLVADRPAPLLAQIGQQGIAWRHLDAATIPTGGRDAGVVMVRQHQRQA